jgi:hypothetical protein
VAKGEAEIGMQQINVILPVAGADYVGPLPVELQGYVELRMRTSGWRLYGPYSQERKACRSARPAGLFFPVSRVVIERPAALRLPAIHHWPEAAEAGGVLAYGPRFSQVY